MSRPEGSVYNGRRVHSHGADPERKMGKRRRKKTCQPTIRSLAIAQRT